MVIQFVIPLTELLLELLSKTLYHLKSNKLRIKNLVIGR